jgi:hypothetical protein
MKRYAVCITDDDGGTGEKGVQAVDKSAEYLDAMSAITCVIDHEKFKRGMGV